MEISTLVVRPSVEATTEILTSVVTRKPTPAITSSLEPVTLIVTATRPRQSTSWSISSSSVVRTAPSTSRLSSTRTTSSIRSTLLAKSSTSTRGTLSTSISRTSLTRKSNIPTKRTSSLPSTSSTKATSLTQRTTSPRATTPQPANTAASTTTNSRIISTLPGLYSSFTTSVSTTTTSIHPTPTSSAPAPTPRSPPSNGPLIAGVSSSLVLVFLITASTLLYKFRIKLGLSSSRDKTQRHSKDIEDQGPKGETVSSHDDTELRPMPAKPTKQESKLPHERIQRSKKRRRSSSSSATSTINLDLDQDVLEELDSDIVAWWQSVYELR